MPDDAVAALRTYRSGAARARRKVQRAAAHNGAIYHQAGMKGALRNVAMRAMGGKRLLRRYDWLYDWRPPEALSIPP